MNVTQELYERIERYLQGRLSVEEQLRFERDMNENQALALEVSVHRNAALRLGNRGELAMEKLITEVIGEYRQDSASVGGGKVRSLKSYKVYWRVAAMLVLAFAIGLSARTVLQPTDYQAVYDYGMKTEYYSPSVVRGTDAKNPLFGKAYDLYLKGDFSEALVVFGELVDQEPNHNDAKLFMGICYLQTDNPSEAISVLNQVEDFQLIDKAQYYMALAYLRQEEVSECVNMLNDLAENHTGRYANMARDLLTKLR